MQSLAKGLACTSLIKAEVSTMPDRVLFVEDEPGALGALKRLFSGEPVEVSAASSAAGAEEAISREEVAVIVSDNLVSGLTGIELLQRVRHISPRTVRILMTAHTDAQAAIDAINKGEVFRILTKPWDEKELRKTVLEAVGRYRVSKTLASADEHTTLAIAQAIELKDPYTKGHCDRVAGYALALAKEAGLDEDTQRLVKLGSWLHDCGKIGVPEAILNHTGPLSKAEWNLVRKHSEWGADVARAAGMDPRIISIILHHHERYDGSGYPYGLKGKDLPVEESVVGIADIFDALMTNRPYRQSWPQEQVISHMKRGSGTLFDPVLIEILIRLL